MTQTNPANISATLTLTGSVEALHGILTALSGAAVDTVSISVSPDAPATPAPEKKKRGRKPKAKTPEPQPEQETADDLLDDPAAPSIDDVKEAVRAFIEDNSMDAAKSIFADFGAKKLSEVDASDFPALIAALTK